MKLYSHNYYSVSQQSLTCKVAGQFIFKAMSSRMLEIINLANFPGSAVFLSLDLPVISQLSPLPDIVILMSATYWLSWMN